MRKEVAPYEGIFNKNMAKKTKTVEKKEPKGWYKGYDMKWLESEPEHPDFYLVEEYKALKSKKK